MLKLPANFKNDIAGKDTALVPIVRIGNVTGAEEGYIFLSTGIYDIRTGSRNPINVLPLLLNIPSLKESIDIEKRNYKISSVNLDISNFPSEGKRFSELIANQSEILQSLINVECRIWWASPSANVPYTDFHPDDDSAAFQIFNGTIRRYTHDDEKVRLVVEDRSQATLHKDLPTAELGFGDDVPSKHRGKKIPMVYGHVDRSPCVIKSSPAIDEWGVGSGNIDIYPDIIPPTINEQYIYFGDKYLPIPTTIENISSEANGVFLGEDFVYNTSDSSQIIDTSITDFIRLMSFGGNPIMKNLIPTREYITIDDVNIIPLREITHDLDGVMPLESQVTDIVNYTSVYDKPNNEVLGTLVKDNSGAVGSWDGSSSLESIVGTSGDIFPDLTTSSYVDRAIPACLVETGVAVGDFKADIGIVDIDIPTYYGNVSERDGSHSIRLSIKSGIKTEIMSQINHTFHDLTYGWHQTSLGTTGTIVFQPEDGAALDRLTIAFWSFINTGGIICAAKFKINSLSMIRYGLVEDIINQDFYANVNGRAISEISILIYEVNWSEENVQGYDDFYNYFWYSPTAPSAIEHILKNELDPEVNIPSLPSEYSDWNYAFTVDKKINSKRLFENIASASPYIPRFDYLGNFKFDVIPESGGEITSEDHHIKEADCISYSFSRTKIEDVYTKIVFKYNWDYARGEFNGSVDVEVDEVIEGEYRYDYYGLTDPEVHNEIDDTYGGLIHPDSTLVIDDDRGKYIRRYDGSSKTTHISFGFMGIISGVEERTDSMQSETALKFAKWFLMWSCNQKLKLKVKLPLKYMNLEIGDFVDFDAILGGVKPYGINYVADDDGSYSEEINGQTIYPTFLITSTNKTLEWVEIECIQMHDLSTEEAFASEDMGILKDDTVMAGLDIGKVKIGSTIA